LNFSELQAKHVGAREGSEEKGKESEGLILPLLLLVTFNKKENSLFSGQILGLKLP
jgi:hypothetical protein